MTVHRGREVRGQKEGYNIQRGKIDHYLPSDLVSTVGPESLGVKLPLESDTPWFGLFRRMSQKWTSLTSSRKCQRGEVCVIRGRLDPEVFEQSSEGKVRGALVNTRGSSRGSIKISCGVKRK